MATKKENISKDAAPVAEKKAKKPCAAKKCADKKVEAPKKAVKKAVNPRAGQPRGHRVSFTYVGEPGKQVFVAGSFNEWNPTERALVDEKGNGEYFVRFLLKSGTYQYKLVVDGQWILDPTNSKLAPNEFGGSNNILEVALED